MPKDIIDSREIISKLEELELDLSDLENATTPETAHLLQEWKDENLQELEILRLVNETGEKYNPEWRHGANLIADNAFVDYAKTVADVDISVWPFTCVDWDLAAKELKRDYVAVELYGIVYLIPKF